MSQKLSNPIKNKEKTGVVLQQQKVERYSGIIPHPSIVEGYENVCPGAADRILAMTENTLKHKHELEKKEQESIAECRIQLLKNENSNFKRGQYFGFVVMMAALVGGIYLLSKGKTISGWAALVSSVLFYFSSVIYKIKKQNRYEEEKE